MSAGIAGPDIDQFVVSTLSAYPEASFHARYGDIGSALNVLAGSEIAAALLAPFVARGEAEAVFKHVMDLAAEGAPRERVQAQLLIQRALNQERDVPVLIADTVTDDTAAEIEGPAQQLVILLLMASDPAIVNRIQVNLSNLADGDSENDAAHFVLWLLERMQEVVDSSEPDR